MKNYRNRLNIIADVLTAARHKTKKTQIMYKANLSYRLLVRYLLNVTKVSFIRFIAEDETYVLTPKGKKFLSLYIDYARSNRMAQKQIKNARGKKKTLEQMCS